MALRLKFCRDKLSGDCFDRETTYPRNAEYLAYDFRSVGHLVYLVDLHLRCIVGIIPRGNEHAAEY